MLGYKNTFHMFHGEQVRDYLARKSEVVKKTIESTAEDYILNVNEEEYINYLVNEFIINTPYIDFDNMVVDSYEGQIPADQFPSSFYVHHGQTYTKQIVIYHIPFMGNAELFKYTPSTFQFSFPQVYLQGQDICFEYINFRDDPDEIKREAESTISTIRFFIGNVSQEVEAYNSGLRGSIQGMLRARRQKLLDNKKLLTSLGVSLKKRDDLPATFSIPTPKNRKPLVVKPNVFEKGYTPEPTLDQTTYHQILEIIHSMGKVFESLPSTYMDKGEEDLRDHLLLQLAPNFKNEGSVTGETFNKVGKTDILYRFNNSNVFVAECKIWKGKDVYLGTIAQLLSYLTWRDSKAAIIMFVKNKEMTTVIETVKGVTSQHPNYLGFVNEEDTSWFNYRFHINDDPNREVKLAVMLYHIPSIFSGRVKQKENN